MAKRYRTWRGEVATISRGNIKLGEMPNVSLLPCTTCGDVPCAKECYANKAVRMYPSARECWRRNTIGALHNLDGFMADIREFLEERQPEFFRWHVAGDIPCEEYLDHMKAIARDHPETNFLAFTKQHHLLYDGLPDNLAIVFSMWPGWGDEQKARSMGIPIAWMQDGSEDRIPGNAIKCPGQCDVCGMCWQLPQLGRDVYFPKH